MLINYSGVNVRIETKAIKHTYMRVKPDGSVLMTVSKRLSSSQIEEILNLHLPKLKVQIKALEQAKNNAEEGILNATYYLGSPYSLSVIESERTQVLIENEKLILHAPNNVLATKLAVPKLLKKWFYTEAELVFYQRFNYWLTKIESWQEPAPTLTIRAMKSRWGSYSKHTHKVTLNLWLIKAPVALIDYVIAHELSHIKHYNHSPAFYSQLANLYPNWHESRKQLRIAAKAYCHE